MENFGRVAAAILGLSVAVGLTGAGYFVSTTVYKGRIASNTVTVRGFAERDVTADLALWQISYSVNGNNLAMVYARSQSNAEAITAFLVQRGFANQDIKSGTLHVTDTHSNPYRPKETAESERYILGNQIAVRSNDVALVDRTMHELNELITQGIVLTSNNVDFEFTKLNDIKAAMLREATQNARDAAQQFADDADSRVGSIQSANQGFFSIVSRDAAVQGTNSEPDYIPALQQNTIDKRVRVVVSLTYYLER